MNVSGILPFARELLSRCIPDGGVAVDATAGKGNDTLFLAKLVGESGHVYSFDIQEQAILATKDKLQLHEIEQRVELIHDGHENLEKYLKLNHKGLVNGAVFNLGYLPGSNKEIVTTPDTTIAAIEELLENLVKGGIIVLVIYHGHPEGAVERDQLLPYVRELAQEDYHVLEYRFTNQQNNPPFIVAIEKR
ncbi:MULTISPECIES: class I SAM-dependent methyltransferase [Bacillaceae]|uniref:Methyltransferase domain-containing protein n=1 Tax=Evansella alkalicola TaxID=745819 RepID=A0ABS6JR52_9BACI|nr:MULTISPECIES: class I SAM-dependent methyltransferase [Bacillaceae]MBU9721046.1 methyltransferase domain-containing protein [Bacillus alkalicola]